MVLRGARPSGHRIGRACAWLIAACLPGLAAAIDPQVPLAALQRSEWTRLQGAPANTSIVLTASDGMLWLIGGGGYVRFDGVRFHRFEPRGGTPQTGGHPTHVRADADGGFWVGHSDGELVHMRGDTLTRMAPVKDIHTGTVHALAVGADDRLWVATKAGVSVLEQGHWRLLGAAEGIAGSQVDDLELGPDGRAWVLTDTGVFVGDARNARFTQVDTVQPGSHMSGLIVPADGQVWRWNLMGEENLCRVVPRAQRGCWKATAPLDPKFDAHGALWWGASDGMSRVVDPGRLGSDPGDLERMAEHVDAHAEAFSFGVDGSVWLAEADALVRLRQTPLQHVPTPTGALAAANDGSVWLGSFTRGLMRVGVPAADTVLLEGDDDTLWTQTAVAASADLRDRMTFEPAAAAPHPGTPVVLARHPEANGATLVRLDPMPGGGVRLATLSPPRLVEYDGRTPREIALPPIDRGALPRGSAVDARGDLWLAVARNGVPFFRLRDDEWQAYGGASGVDSQAINGFAMHDDAVWIAIGSDAVGRVEGGAWTRFGPADGLDLGQAIQPLLHEGRVWMTGSRGLQVLVGKRFVSIVGNDGDRFIGSSGALHLDNGDLWLNGIAGLSRIERREWETVLRDPAHRVAYTRFDPFEGNMSSAMQGAPLPSLVRSSDGRLWAATHTGLLRLDPAAVRPALPPPAVQLLSLSADGARHALDDGVALPVGASRIGLGFTVPPTDSPERIRVRYRLQGQPWIDAGDRRDVMYEALPPGTHVFEVVATDREGRWGETPTRLGFVLPPRFHQTVLFRALIGVAVVALLALLYGIRIRQVSERTRRETTARLHERMRISRDLHDTLLQSVQALHMHVQAIAARVPDDDPLRPRIDLVLDRAQDTIREGRDRISTLRDPLAGTTDLAECLQRIAQRLAREADVLCDVQIDTPPRALQPIVYDELLHMGREALTNALQHANATRVTLRIAFTDEAASIAIADDGCGFPSDVLQHGGRDGHFGMRGMRERAALAGAELLVRNGEGAGAEVVIRVPASRAYLRTPRPRRWFASLRQPGEPRDPVPFAPD